MYVPSPAVPPRGEAVHTLSYTSKSNPNFLNAQARSSSELPGACGKCMGEMWGKGRGIVRSLVVAGVMRS